MHKNVDMDWTCSSGDALADRHTHRRTNTENAGSEIGGSNEELFTSVLYDKRMNIGLSRRP